LFSKQNPEKYFSGFFVTYAKVFDMLSPNHKARNRAILFLLLLVVAILYCVGFIRVGGRPF
jgi:hypothetical protein